MATLSDLAEAVGFEPTGELLRADPNGFKDRRNKPLCHASMRSGAHQGPYLSAPKARSDTGLLVIASTIGEQGRRGYRSSHDESPCGQYGAARGCAQAKSTSANSSPEYFLPICLCWAINVMSALSDGDRKWRKWKSELGRQTTRR